jgi:VanZ family protein
MSERTRPPIARLVSLLLPPLAVMALIFFFSAQQSDGHHAAIVVVLRKLAHVTEYAVLTLCWWRALRGLGVGSRVGGRVRGEGRVPIALAVAIALAYAATDEFHQTFIHGRHGTPIDVLVDAIGMTIAGVLASRAYPRRRTLGPSRPSAA